MSADSDHYAVLGISADAESAVIRDAYRSSMRKYHPDLNTNDDAAGRARAVNEAYRVLRDPKSRAQYDSYRRRKIRAYEVHSPHDGCLVAVSERRQVIEIRSLPERAARASWLPVLLFVLVAAGLVLAIVSSGKLDPPSTNFTENRSLNGGGGADKRIDDLIARIVDDGGAGAPQGLASRDASLEAKEARSEATAFSSPPIRESDIAYGAGKFAEVSLRSGMLGAQKYSIGCHQDSDQNPSWQHADRCAAFDMTATFVDAEVARLTHGRTNPYFFRMQEANDAYRALGVSRYEEQLRGGQIRQALLPMVRSKTSMVGTN